MAHYRHYDFKWFMRIIMQTYIIVPENLFYDFNCIQLRSELNTRKSLYRFLELTANLFLGLNNLY